MPIGPIDRNLSGAAENFGSPYLRDYAHASLAFRSNNYQNAPKFKFLFHTYFEINPEAFQGFNRRGVGPIDSSTNFGIMVKTAQLPTYTVEAETMNQYNRKRIIQKKIKYNPVDIVFHDDNGDQINQMWEAYYTYYYYDALNPNVQFGGSRGSTGSGPNNYNQRNIYNESISGDSNWGFNSDSTTGDQVKKPFFKNITIFGFNQKNFVAYTLVNPIITNYTHGTYDYSAGDGTMENRMTLEYETALYNYGALDGENPTNLIPGGPGNNETYDRTPSPIWNPGSNSLNLGTQGLTASDGGYIQGNRRSNPNDPFGQDLLFENGNGPISEFGPNASNNFDPLENLSVNSGSELESMLTELPDPANRNVEFFNPIPGSTPTLLGTAGSPAIGTDPDDTVIRDEPVSGSQFTGEDLTSGPRLDFDPEDL